MKSLAYQQKIMCKGSKAKGLMRTHPNHLKTMKLLIESVQEPLLSIFYQHAVQNNYCNIDGQKGVENSSK